MNDVYAVKRRARLAHRQQQMKNGQITAADVIGIVQTLTANEWLDIIGDDK